MKHVFKELVDIPRLQTLTDAFYAVTTIPCFITALEGEILTGSGWQPVCADFHLRHPGVKGVCPAGGTGACGDVGKIVLEQDDYVIFQCPMGLIGGRSPIIVGDAHVADVFWGQVFLSSPGRPDMAVFRRRARQYGFDEAAYLDAVAQVPVVSMEKFKNGLFFISTLVRTIGDLVSARLKERRIVQALQKKEAEYRSTADSLERSREMFLKTFKSAPMLMSISELKDGCYLDVNDAFVQCSGHSRERAVGRTSTELNFITAADRKKLKEMLEKQGRLDNMEINLTRADGTGLTCLYSGEIIQVDGKPRLLSIACDITERKMAREKYREAVSWYQAIFQGSRDAISITDENARFIEVNEAACRLTGYSAEALLKMRIPDIHETMGLVAYGKYYARIMAGDTIISQSRILCRDGTRVDTEFSSRRVIILDKPYMHTTARDIRQRKHRDREIKTLTERLTLATDAAGIGVWDLDLINDVLFWDDWMYRLYGVDPADFNGAYAAWQKSVHPEDLAAAEREVALVVSGEKDFDMVFRIVRPDGEVRFIKANGRVIRDDRGSPLRMVGVNQDITRQKRDEERIQEAQKMESIGNLAGGIAHDFNNILFPVVGMAELLLQDLPQGSLEYKNVEEILTAARRGSALVKQILAFSRQHRHELIPVRLQKVLGEVIKLSRSTIPANIKITHEIQPDCGLVLADAVQMHQVAMNLVTNAYHAVVDTDHGGAIVLRLQERSLEGRDAHGDGLPGPGRYAVMTIADNGCGMTPAVMAKVFEPYFTTKEKGKGTGLGLAVVYGIIRSHKGHIHIDSFPDRGTTITVYLPLMQGRPKADEMAQAQVQLPIGTEQILLVDDEPAIVNLLKIMLSRQGYIVHEHTASPEALEAFRASPWDYDLVITDMSMPHMTGEQLVQHIHALRPDMPVIICSGFSERVSAKNAREMGFKGFLMKPVALEQMARMVRDALDSNL